MADPAQMMMWMRDNAVMKPAFDKLADDKKSRQIPNWSITSTSIY